MSFCKTWWLLKEKMKKSRWAAPLWDDFQVIAFYLFPRVFVNIMGVVSLTLLAVIWLFGSYFTVTRDKLVLSIALAGWVIIFGVARVVLSGPLAGRMKEAAELHFNQALQGVPTNKNPADYPSDGRRKNVEQVASPGAHPASWLTEEEILRASRHVLSFLQVVVRAQDKYTLTPPIIEVNSVETRRLSRLPGDSGSTVPEAASSKTIDVIPLALIAKGFLRNNFSASVDDETVQLLGSRDAEALALVLVDSLCRQVLDGRHEELVQRVRQVVVADPPLPRFEVSQVITEIRSNTLAAEDSDSQKLRAHLCQLLYHLSTDQLIFGVVGDLQSKAFITVGQKWTIKHQIVTGGVHKTGRLSEKLRALLGLTPRLFFIPMSSLARTESYHFEVIIPEGLYYYKGMAIVGGEQFASKNASIGNRRINHLHSSSVGTSLVHEMYKEVEGGRAPEKSAPIEQSKDQAFFALHLRETPPGVGLILAVGAVATVALVAYMAHIGSGQSQGPAIPAILASLPAILAGWMVSRLHGEALGKMSLASAVNVVWYIINSIVAALLPSALDDKQRTVVWDFHEFHSDSIWVGLLAVSVCANAFSIGWHFLLRSTRYNARLAS